MEYLSLQSSRHKNTGAVLPAQIEAWRAGSIGGTSLLRALVEHDRWELPVTEPSLQMLRATNAAPEPWLYRDADGAYRLFLFSARASWDQFRVAAAVHYDQPLATTAGLSIFTRDLTSLAGLHIDPLCPEALTLGSELFTRLNIVADAVHVERSLTQLRGGVSRVATQLSVVRSFNAWHVGFSHANGTRQLALAPDARGRVLASAFTLRDCYEAFAREVESTTGPLEHAILRGEVLFAMLLEGAFDGIVFNCCGPASPVAFAPAFARLVLDG
jgi:hypothetical protein